MMEDTRLGVVRGISYGLFAPPVPFVAPARALGARLVRAYLYWSQFEPEPGRYDWSTVDSLLAQLDGDTELWLTVCSSSPWATRSATDFLPPSPALSLPVYAESIRRLAQRCAGRIRFWQCDNEPSNTGLLWAGTADEYAAQLAVFHEAVCSADPAALVVLGGCGYDALSGGEPRKFFDRVAALSRDSFDLFDVHLYADPYRVPEFVATAREIMARHGYEKPIVAGEHGGPLLFEFPELDDILAQVFAEAFTADVPPSSQSTAELAERASTETPERRALRSLYARADKLPPRLRMLMADAPADLAAKRDRIDARQVVVRTVLALASGIRRTAYWNLAPEIAGFHDPYQMMDLLFGRLPLLDGTLSVRSPAADAFARLAELLSDVESVRRMDDAAWVFVAERRERGQVWIIWDRRDTFDGEDEPAVSVALPWEGPASAVDAFGTAVPVAVADGTARLTVTDTPVYLSRG